MDHTTLTAAQYAPVIARLTRERDYLGKLVQRMRANGFPVDDPLVGAVVRAWEATSNACVAAATCRNKVHGAGSTGLNTGPRRCHDRPYPIAFAGRVIAPPPRGPAPRRGC